MSLDNFIGFIIANQYEEFLLYYDIHKGFTSFLWTPFPSFAHVFKSREECRKVMKALLDPKYSLWEMSLSETETQYIVSYVGRDFPPWYGKNNPANNFH